MRNSKMIKRPRASMAGGTDDAVEDSVEEDGLEEDGSGVDHFRRLSLELLCHVLDYLPLCDQMKMESLSKQWQEAVNMNLKLLSELFLCENRTYDWMPSGFSDDSFAKFLLRCPAVAIIYGLHAKKLSRRRQRGCDTLSVPGVISALQDCPHLIAVEISDIHLLESVLSYLQHVDIVGTFRNRNGCFPIPERNKFSLTRTIQLTSLHLTGVIVEKLPALDFLEELYLKWVMFTDQHPFREFAASSLRMFVMSNCAGPPNALKYVPLVTALAGAQYLKRMDLVRVPFLGGLFQHVVEDSWRPGGFRLLDRILFGACKHVLETDAGYLCITCSANLRDLSLQPSLTKDSFFSSLQLSQVQFPSFESLALGYTDPFPPPKRYSAAALAAAGLTEVTENPSSVSDVGMKAVGLIFRNVSQLTLFNCPYIHSMNSWFVEGQRSFSLLRELHLKRCHSLQLNSLLACLASLPLLEVLHLESMFRESPKGCSRVGLSAGTGLGVSSALVANHGGDAAQMINNNEEEEDEEEEGEEEEPPLANDPQPVALQGEPNANAAQGEVVIEDGMFYDVPSNNPAVLPLGSASLHEDEDENEEGKLGASPQAALPGCSKDKDGAACEKGQSQDRAGEAEVCGNATVVTETLQNADVPKVDRAQTPSQETYSRKGKSLSGKKKGLVKRSKPPPVQTQDKACQAVSLEIRECTKHANRKNPQGKNAQTSAGTASCVCREGRGGKVIKGRRPSSDDSRASSYEGPASNTRSSNHRVETVRKTNMRDQATSTSDPVMEEDHFQVLVLESVSLRALILQEVGITCLTLQNCPHLHCLTIQHCRVLRDVLVSHAPQLRKIFASQCKKMRYEDVVDEICSQPSVVDRVFTFRPIDDYSPDVMERTLFRSSNIDGHLCLLYDNNADPRAMGAMLRTRLLFQKAVAAASKLTRCLLKHGHPVARRQEEGWQYPWGRHISRQWSRGENYSHWDMVTDIPWMKTDLSTLSALHHSCSLDASADGMKWCDVPPSMVADVAEVRETQQPLFAHSVLVLVSLCDADYQLMPLYDEYI